DGDGREIIDEIEGILDLVRDARGQLAERSKLLGLYQAVLGRLQLLKRSRELPGASLDAFEQADVLDGDRSLVGKSRHEIDLPVGEWLHLRAGERQDAERLALAQHGNAEDRAISAEPLGFGEGIFRIGLD